MQKLPTALSSRYVTNAKKGKLMKTERGMVLFRPSARKQKKILLGGERPILRVCIKAVRPGK